MRASLLGLMLITACYAPVVPSGVPCSVHHGQCPDGLSCIAGFCGDLPRLDPDAAPPDAPPGTIDTDKDGVPDNLDNCPTVANTDQLNEDGDGPGDACDACPQIANAAATDSDGDGLPDACDPNPTGTTHDTRWLFEGFHAGLPMQWTGSTHWAPSGDSDTVRVTAPGGSNDNSEYVTLPLTSPGRTSFDNFELTVAFTIDSTTGNSGPEIGFDLYDQSSGRDAYCTLYLDSSNGSHHLGTYEYKGTTKTIDGSKSFNWQTGTQYTLTMLRRGATGTTVTCTVAGPGGQPTLTSTMSSVVVPRTGGDSYLWAFGATARVDWVFVAGTP